MGCAIRGVVGIVVLAMFTACTDVEDHGGGQAVAPIPTVDETVGWDDGSSPDDKPQDEPAPSPLCGDGVCSAWEDGGLCPQDCLGQEICGDGSCVGEESTLSCALDCGTDCGDGACNGDEDALGCMADCSGKCGDGTCGLAEGTVECVPDCGSACGDGACNGEETTALCAEDCGSLCGDGACSGAESTANCVNDCGSACGDGQCNGDEDTIGCTGDCGSLCGDGSCNGGESSASCTEDCGASCGDDACNADEDTITCPSDCGTACGDVVCNGQEDTATCPDDCGSACGDGACNGGETTTECPDDCGSACGDGACNGAEGTATCSADCGSLCGDGICNGPEGSTGCPGDCGSECGDGICNGDEGTATCLVDCGSACGDGICNGLESPVGCAADCGSACGDSACNGDEATWSCPDDCGSSCGDGVCNGNEQPGGCVSDCGELVGSCPDVPLPDPAKEAPLDYTVPGPWETTTVDGFTDDYLSNADGSFKVGLRRDWGGTIIFFGFSGDGPGVNATNVIDSHDTGREVQVAFYDSQRAMQGCAHNASCITNPATMCPSQITYLGWNPVQGGNECNQGSGVDWVQGLDSVLSMETTPLFWNPDWQLPTCGDGACSSAATSAMKSDVRYTQRLRFVNSHVVEIDMRIENLSDTEHMTTHQEFPTLYGSFGHDGTPNLSRIMASTGDQMVPYSQDGNGFSYGDYTSPGGWTTLQDAAKSYGVGLYHENRLETFRGYQQDGVFNNFRALFPFAIPAKGTVRARAYLMLGSFNTIKSLAEDLDASLGPFGGLDAPASDAGLTGDVATVAGWVLDNKDVSLVEALVDGEAQTTLDVAESRPDICARYPGYAMCDGAVGYGGTISLSELSPCGHILEIRATDSDGNTRIVARRRFFVGAQPNPEPEIQAKVLLYRYAWASGPDADHMFGTGAAPPDGYQTEGQAFHLFAEPAAGLVPLYQSYCAPCTDHLQSTTNGEGSPTYAGHAVLGYCASQQSTQAPVKLQRLWNPDNSDHFVTRDVSEVTTATQSGYQVEGHCWVP